MNEYDELKSIWKKNDGQPILTACQLESKANRERKIQILSALLLILALIATCFVILWVILNYDAKYGSTYWGVGITLFAVTLAIISQTQVLRFLFKPVDLLTDNHTYLNLLVKQQQYQAFIHSKGISLYFLLLSTGISLYMVEFAMRSLLFGIVSYSIVGAWIAINWFYFRPKIIRKQRDKLNALMEEVTRVSIQMQ